MTYHSVPFEWKVIFVDTISTNRSGTPSWVKSLLMCKERILMTTMKTRHAVVWGICNKKSPRVLLFADSRRSNPGPTMSPSLSSTTSLTSSRNSMKENPLNHLSLPSSQDKWPSPPPLCQQSPCIERGHNLGSFTLSL